MSRNVMVIGSRAGGSTIASALVRAGATVTLVDYPWEAPRYVIPLEEARCSDELRTLCAMAPDPANRLTFETDRPDAFGLPKVSGRIVLSPADRAQLHAGELAHAELARAIEDRVTPPSRA